jgi:signal peptidase I
MKISFFLEKVILFSLRLIVIILLSLIILYNFVIQPKEIKGSSMFPVFKDGQYVLVNKISYFKESPKRGEIIIFHSPKNPNSDYIERIIAIPNDILEIKDLGLFLNNNPINEPYLLPGTETHPNIYLQKNQKIKIPKNKYFVMGDNRSHSVDSRDWGFVPKENILGKVTVCIRNCK